MNNQLSSCCISRIRVEGDSFGEGTNYYVCMKCGKACDPMTLPEDVREAIEIVLYNDLAERGIDQEVGSPFCLVANHHSHIVMRFLTTAKAEGYQEGVKAMQKEAKELVSTANTCDWNAVRNFVDESPLAMEYRITKQIVFRADQLLNPQGEEK